MPTDETLDLLGCPMCNLDFCQYHYHYQDYEARERGHIVCGRYVLDDAKGQYLLFTAGLQMIKLAPMVRLR